MSPYKDFTMNKPYLLIFGLVTLFLCSCNPSSSDENEKVDKIIDQTGGSISLSDGATLTLPAGVLIKEKKVVVESVSTLPSSRDKNVLLPKKAYKFEVENQDKFNLPLELKIPYDESEIPSGHEEGDLKVAFYDEEAKAWIPVESDQDAQNNILTVSTSHLSLWTWIVDQFRVKHYNTENFLIDYLSEGPNGVSDIAYVEKIGMVLEDAKVKLEGLGFKVRKKLDLKVVLPGGGVRYDKHKVKVLIRPQGKNYGQAVRSKLGDHFNYIELDNKTDEDIIKVTAIHEYFHLSQDLYFTNLWWVQTPYIWICEAAALWWENEMFPTLEGYLEQLNANADFVTKTLDTRTDDHGYGAATFIKYLAFKHTKEIVSKIFGKIEGQSVGGRSPIEAINEALVEYNSSIEESYQNFALAYYTSHDFDQAAKWAVPTKELEVLSSSNQKVTIPMKIPPLSAKAYTIKSDFSEGKITLDAKFSSNESKHHKVTVYAGESRGSEIVNWPVAGTLINQSNLTVSKFGKVIDKEVDKNLMVLVIVNSDPKEKLSGNLYLEFIEENDPAAANTSSGSTTSQEYGAISGVYYSYSKLQTNYSSSGDLLFVTSEDQKVILSIPYQVEYELVHETDQGFVDYVETGFKFAKGLTTQGVPVGRWMVCGGSSVNNLGTCSKAVTVSKNSNVNVTVGSPN